MIERAPVDLALIEREYRAGVKSIQQIARENDRAPATICGWAKKYGWERDLHMRVQTAAAAIVARSEVPKTPGKRGPKEQSLTPDELMGLVEANADTPKKAHERQMTEKEIVEANATKVADVQISHRKDITRTRTLVMRLLEECEQQSGEPELFRRLGEIMRKDDITGMSDAYEKVISLPQRIKGVKELTEALRALVGMEREAYGITASYKEGDDEKVDIVDAARRIAFAFARASAQLDSSKGT